MSIIYDKNGKSIGVQGAMGGIGDPGINRDEVLVTEDKAKRIEHLQSIMKDAQKSEQKLFFEIKKLMEAWAEQKAIVWAMQAEIDDLQAETPKSK